MDQIIQSNLPKALKANLTKDIVKYYFSNSIFDEIGKDLSSILTKYIACYLRNSTHGSYTTDPKMELCIS